MKFVRFGNWQTGLLLDGSAGPVIIDIHASFARGVVGYRDIAGIVPDDWRGSWIDLIAEWDKVKPVLEALLTAAMAGDQAVVSLALASTPLLPPLADRQCRIFAIGGNFSQHVAAASEKAGGRSGSASFFAEEKAQGMPPWGFLVFNDTLVGQDTLVTPPDGVQKFDYEAEVAVVLRSGGKDIAEDEVRIWGYTGWNDLSIRDPRLGIPPLMDRASFTWGLEKNFDGSHPCGPCLVVDENADVQALHCVMRVNGAVRQDFNTAEMIWSFADTAAHLSHYLTLRTGDIIASGTGAGTAIEAGKDGAYWLQPGDALEVEIEGVGLLRTRIGAWSQ